MAWGSKSYFRSCCYFLCFVFLLVFFLFQLALPGQSARQVRRLPQFVVSLSLFFPVPHLSTSKVVILFVAHGPWPMAMVIQVGLELGLVELTLLQSSYRD